MAKGNKQKQVNGSEREIKALLLTVSGKLRKHMDADIEDSSIQVFPEESMLISASGNMVEVDLVGMPMAMNHLCYELRCKTGKSAFCIYFETGVPVSTLQLQAHGSSPGEITQDTLTGPKITEHPAKFVYILKKKLRH